MKHKNDENIEKPKSKIFLKIFIILIFLAGIIFSLKIAPNYNGLVVQTNNASEAAVAAQKIVMKDAKFISEMIY